MNTVTIIIFIIFIFIFISILIRILIIFLLSLKGFSLKLLLLILLKLKKKCYCIQNGILSIISPQWLLLPIPCLYFHYLHQYHHHQSLRQKSLPPRHLLVDEVANY